MKIAPPIGLLICSSISCWLLFNVSLVAETAPAAPRGVGPEPAFPAYLGSFTDTLSLSGKFVVLRARGGDHGPNPRGEALTVFDLDGKEISRHGSPPHTPGHGDLALTSDLEDVMVGRSDDGWPEHPHYYGAVSWSLRDDKLHALGPAGSHTSGRALRLPGWVFASTFGKGGAVFMVKLDGSGETRTVCQTWHREPVNYWAQTQAVPSPTGTRVLVATNWGTGPDYDDEEAHSFVADLRIRP